MLKPKRKILSQEIEHDPFLDTLLSIRQHFQNHKRLYFKSIGAFIVSLVIVILFIRSNNSNNDSAQYVLSKGMVYLQQQDELNAMIFLQEANENFSGTKASIDAGYYLGKIYFDRGDYRLSETLFKEYLDDGSNILLLRSSFKALVDINLSKNELQTALRYQNLYIKNISFKSDIAYAKIELAKLQYINNEKEVAKSTINSIIDDYSDDFEIIQAADKAYGEIIAN